MTLGRLLKPSGPQFLCEAGQEVVSGTGLRQGHRQVPEPSATISFVFPKLDLPHLELQKTSF